MENKLTQKQKLEIKGISIHFEIEEKEEKHAATCRITYNEGIGVDNMATVYKSIKDFYDTASFENIK
jgi:hypothetical protein